MKFTGPVIVNSIPLSDQLDAFQDLSSNIHVRREEYKQNVNRKPFIQLHGEISKATVIKCTAV